MINYFIKFLRKNIILYIIFINIYKKFIYLFYFIENNKYYFLNNNKIKTILDIGSNNFQIAKLILKIRKKIKKTKIYCFEPNPLINKINNKNIISYKHALGNVNKNSYLFLPFYKNYMIDSIASFKKENIYKYLKKNSISFKKIFIKKILIKIKKLDNKKINFQFIKIDTEGTELDVLKGSVDNIKKNNPIILIEKNTDFFLVKKFLNKLRYKSYNYNHVKNEFNLDANPNFDDIFFLNKNSFKYIN
jgi:FkbM family methyltransferase